MKKTSNEEKVIAQVKVSTYYNDYVTKIESKFRKIVEGGSAVCPLHDENDPSFSDWNDKGLFHCFGCNSTGDVITLHQRVQFRHHRHNLTRNKAMEELARIYGVELEVDEKGEIVVENPFSKARRKMGVGVQNKQESTGMPLAEYRRYNAQIRGNTRIAEGVKIKNYQKIDIMMGIQMQQKEAKEYE